MEKNYNLQENLFIEARSLKRQADSELNSVKAEMLYQQSDKLLYQVLFKKKEKKTVLKKKLKIFITEIFTLIITILIKLQ